MKKKEITEAEMLHKMAAWCSTAERCVQDVEKKIEAADLPADASERIISRLLKEKFIDEERFCRSFVRDKLRFNKWGRVKISYELRSKGISSTLSAEALGGIDEAEYTQILSGLLKDKTRSLKGEDAWKDSQKLLRYAAGRGFTADETIRCMRYLTNLPVDEDISDYLE